MRRPRIYVDTSVIGGCFDPEFAHWSNGLMADFSAGRFIPIVSRLTASEIEGAPEPVQKKLAEILGFNHELIRVEDEALELASRYQDHGILTPRYYDDGLHIALATIVSADLVVSWNFRHIVRFDKIRRFNAVNLENGYKTLEIHTPREVTTLEKD